MTEGVNFGSKLRDVIYEFSLSLLHKVYFNKYHKEIAA